MSKRLLHIIYVGGRRLAGRSIALICLMVLSLCAGSVQAAVVTYQVDNSTIFPNPERGFTEEFSRKVSKSRPHVIQGEVDDEWFTSGEQVNMRLMMVLYNLGNFKSQDLPSEVLNAFDDDMQVLRSHGWKCVLRFAYSETTSDKTDATPEWVERHLAQLGPHLTANADVIYVVEAGFVGVWGEWYYSRNYGNETQHLNANRRRVVDALMANVPSDRFVLFRYPTTKFDYFGDTTPLSSSEAFTGSTRARMGYHNDAFLHDWGNMGTYASDELDDDPAVRQYISTETLYVPNGGETNIDDDDALAAQRYAMAPAEMSTYHWSFCGSSYAEPVTNRWRSSGIFDTLNIHMGYRFSLISAQLSDSAAPAGKANVTIQLCNTGYAPLYNYRVAYLVLSQNHGHHLIPLQTDPRTWQPNGAATTIREQISIPDILPEGTYHLQLYLPDPYPSIKADPRYAIRLANVGVWNATLGMNDLGADIVISHLAPLDPDDGASLQDAAEVKKSVAQKQIQNGQICIMMPDGSRYSILGQPLTR